MEYVRIGTLSILSLQVGDVLHDFHTICVSLEPRPSVQFFFRSHGKNREQNCAEGLGSRLTMCYITFICSIYTHFLVMQNLLNWALCMP